MHRTDLRLSTWLLEPALVTYFTYYGGRSVALRRESQAGLLCSCVDRI